MAEELKEEYHPQLIKELSKTVHSFENRTVNLNDLNKVYLNNLILANIDHVHFETLLNLPTVVKRLDINYSSND